MGRGRREQTRLPKPRSFLREGGEAERSPHTAGATDPEAKGAGSICPLGTILLLSAPPLTALPVSPTAKPRIWVNGSQDAESALRLTAKTGEEVTLDCEAQGSPPPLVTWTKDARPLLPGTDRYPKARASGRGRFAGLGPGWGLCGHPGWLTSFDPGAPSLCRDPRGSVGAPGRHTPK